jgi:hypothetical protein
MNKKIELDLFIVIILISIMVSFFSGMYIADQKYIKEPGTFIYLDNSKTIDSLIKKIEKYDFEKFDTIYSNFSEHELDSIFDSRPDLRKYFK